MTDTKITIVCREGEDHITDISLTAERNYTPIFTEAFSTQEKPLNVYLIKDKDILSENAAKSGAEQILSNLIELIRNSLKDESTGIYPRRIGFEISNHRLSYHKTV